jgi:type IV secretion system protein VirB6
VFDGFLAWLDGVLSVYVATETARVAAALEPAAAAFGAIYVMLWGFLHLQGRIDEPVMDGVKRIVWLGAVLGLSLSLWSYQALFVSTFIDGPRALAAALVGGSDPVQTVDRVWESGGTIAGILWERGGLFDGDLGFYVAALFVWVLVGGLCVYVTFLLALSQIAAAVLLALGPLFLLALLFDSTRRWFELWLGQLVNFGLIVVLTLGVAALLLQIVESYATQTAARGPALLSVDAIHLLLATAIVLLVLTQVLPIASGLARGVALSAGGWVGRAGGAAAAVTRIGGYAVVNRVVSDARRVV